MRLALCQTNSGDDVVANERQVTGLLERAAEGGADLAALPEVWPRQGSAKQIRESAEPVPGPRTERLAEIAARHRMWVHGGSVLERDGERVFNTSVLFDREGNLVATYRKIHLFDADPPGAVPSRESSVFSAGDQVVTSETEFGRVGMSICYDVRFPELYRALAVQGATILFVPAAFRFETGVDHWEPLLRARAIEDQAFVVAAAQWGTWGPPGPGAPELRSQPGRRPVGHRDRRGPRRGRGDLRRAGPGTGRARPPDPALPAPPQAAALLLTPTPEPFGRAQPFGRWSDARYVVTPG